MWLMLKTLRIFKSISQEYSDFIALLRRAIGKANSHVAKMGLVKLVSEDKSKDPVAPLSQIKVLPHKEKDGWTLSAKYNIGKKR